MLLNSHEIFLSWGVRSDPNLPLNLLVVRQDSSASYYQPFNSFKIKFTLQQDTPDSVELRVNVFIQSEKQAALLTGSIIHNLVSATDKVVTCKELYADSVTNRQISCFGVGKLLASQEYHLAFKMSFPQDDKQESISM